MTKIFIINGLGGCGKSTFSKFCIDYYKEKYNKNAYEVSTVDYVKEVAEYCGWQHTKFNKDRIFLHDIKEALEAWNDSPTISVFNKIEELDKNSNNNIYFVNIRESKYIEKFIRFAEDKNYYIETIIVEAPNIKSNEVPELVNDIYSISYDYYIINDGSLEDLKKSAELFIDSVR